MLTTNVREYWNGSLKGEVIISYNDSGVSGQDRVLLGNGNLDADMAEVLYFNTDLTERDVQKLFFT